MKSKSIIIFLLISSLTYGQNNIEDLDLIPVDHLKNDLQVMKYNLESIHPGLYTYTKKEELDAFFTRIEQKIKSPMSNIEFYRLLAPLQSKIKNGHTMSIPSEKWSNYKDSQKPLFPFEIYYDNKSLYVLKNLSEDESINNGIEIISINGQSAQNVISQLLNNITKDGNNSTYPTKLLQLGFLHWYADITGTPESFELEFKLNNQKLYTKKIKALSLKEIKRNHLSRYNEEKIPWYLKADENFLSLKIENEIATLIVPTFDSSAKSGTNKKYKRFYRDAFKKIKSSNVKYLILDLRDNGGGDPKPQLALLSYLIDKPLKLYKRTYAITRKIPNPTLYKDDKIKRLNFLSKLALKKRDSIFLETSNLFARLSGAPSRKPKLPAKDIFNGELYILINGGSFSATGEVAGILKNHNRGIFIGEETGGSDYQNSSGIMIMLYLPYSQIRVRIPMLCYELNIDYKNDGLGVIPDYTITKSITESLDKKDPVLEHALNLINDSRKK